MLFEKLSDIHFIRWFSKKQKEKLNKIPTNKPVKTFYQAIAKTTSFYHPSLISKAIYVYVDSYLQTQNVY